MSETIDTLNSPKAIIGEPSKRRLAQWTDRVDALCLQLGDLMNPILVKETRQALKSRQFVITFSVLLIAALAWTVIGSLSMMPQIYTSPSAPRMLVGYYVVLAIPMLLVVPLAAYRSLEGEIDDGTLELLSITTMLPWQIVLGKLASASLQMVLYLVALFPCVAYAYTLRGVDLPTTMIIIGVLVASALLLTVVALFFAPLSRTRTGRIGTLLAVMLILINAEWGVGAMVISMILYGNPLPIDWVMFLTAAVVLVGLALGHLLLTATAAQLTPESENRSTPLRISLLILSSVMVGLSAYACTELGETGLAVHGVFAMSLATIWLLCGALMSAESTVMTPRIRRELPQSFAARLALTWLTPGPGTGLVFASVCILLLCGASVVGLYYSITMYAPGRGIGTAVWRQFVQLHVLYASYAIAMLCLVRAVVAIVRMKNQPPVQVGIAAFLAIAVVVALVPYSVGLHYNDYRPYAYSWWQLPNWAWTFQQSLDRSLLRGEEYVIAFAAGCMLMGALMLSPSLVMPRRTATPRRVKEERLAESRVGTAPPDPDAVT
tara:strand:- start:12409 stop:14058 length:1650 start_codon:yes stop_codon:yes gene_type:complete